VSVGLGVGLEVGPYLVAAGEVREVRRHGEVLEVGHVPRGDEVQRVIVGVPVAADPVGLLVAVDVVAGLAELLQGGDAGRTGPDDAVAGHGRSSFPAGVGGMGFSG
jgi:hypothetical protein